MIIQFSIGNYRSFNSIQTINFRATDIVSDDQTIDTNNIANVDGQKILKTIGVYGANASGKSNLVQSIYIYKEMIVESLASRRHYANQFKQSSTIQDEAYFQAVLMLDGKKYRYGFTFGTKGIGSEWLAGPGENSNTYYFTRSGNEITIDHTYFQEGMNIPYDTKLRQDTLFLTFCSAYNGTISNIIRDYFDRKVNDLSLDFAFQYNNINTNELVVNGNKEIVLNWLNEAGLSFSDIEIKNMGSGERFNRENNQVEELGYKEGSVKLYKNVYNEHGGITGTVQMDLSIDESDGTRKYYSFIGKLYNVFENGGLVMSDEIDSNFHPSLLRKLIYLFNSPVNKANAQLLFTSHDTNLMNPGIMRRDQFYFTEKSLTESTHLYSLSDLKGIKNNADFATQYLAGYYGSIPVLGNFLEDAIIHNSENI